MTFRSMLAVSLVCASISTAHADASFAAGSIVIPATATYQTDCGAVSVYGFVYNVLRANAWLQANGYGTIEMYYAIKDTKGSPNRCVPTNLLTPPAPTADPRWNDGCDFQVFSSNPSTVPVKRLVNTTAHTLSTDLASFSTFLTTDLAHTDVNSGTGTYPNWPGQTISAPATTTVRYSGGAFIVDDLDAAVLRRLISGNLVARDAVVGGSNIDFTPFRTSACTFGTTVGGQLDFHVAQVAFTAPTPKVLSSKPPRVALLGRNDAARTGRVASSILEGYLSRAGLTFPGAQGCALGGYLETNQPALCPSPNRTGQIFDLLDFADLMGANLAASKLGATDLGVQRYKMFWAPHWQFFAPNPDANERQVLANIVDFADGRNGVMAECASIGAFEGHSATYSNEPMNAQASSQFQTCTVGSCNPLPVGIEPNSAGTRANSGPFAHNSLQNCTDPGLANGRPCTYFGSPGDAFSQTGDYRFSALQGVGSNVSDFSPLQAPSIVPGCCR